MNHYKAIQLHALACVLDEDFDDNYRLRQLLRWYSIKFTTPLHEVYQLPIPFVLEHYYECQYENEKPQDLEKTRELLLETEKEKEEREKKEEMERLEDEEFAKLAAEEEVKKVADPIQTIQTAAKALSDSLENMKSMDLSLFPELKTGKLKETKLPTAKQKPIEGIEKLQIDENTAGIEDLDSLFVK